MPVCLDAIPDPAPPVPRPDTRRWLLLLALMIMGGIALVLHSWASERSGFVFWFTALGLPFCLWGLIFSLRRFAYKAGQVAAEARNVEREKLIDNEIRRGQRCAWILGCHIQTPAASTPAALLESWSRTIPMFDLALPRGGSSPVRYAALPELQENFSDRLMTAISWLADRAWEIVKTLPGDIPCWLMLDCDDDLYAQVKAKLAEGLAEVTGRHIRPLNGSGMDALDGWLDQAWGRPGILLAVTLSLPARPEQGDCDAITLVVLSNRPAAVFPAALRLHRPEKGAPETLGCALTRALLWANAEPGALCGSWYSGKALSQAGGWNRACEEQGVTFSLTTDNRAIDAVLGYAGRASPWLAVVLANGVTEQQGPQVIAVQPGADRDDIWVMVITQH